MPNTGRKLVLSLKKVQQGTTTPTIETKPNISTDPNYIAPYVSPDCPVTYDSVCPSVVLTDTRDEVRFEFSLTDSTINNPTINTVRVELIIQDSGTVEDFMVFNKPFTNFFSGVFSRPIARGYYFNVIFFDSGGATIGTPCTGLGVIEII
jgi:hypothetical protein